MPFASLACSLAAGPSALPAAQFKTTAPIPTRLQHTRAARRQPQPPAAISQEGPAAAAAAATPTADETRVRAEATRRIKELGRQGKAREAVGELAAMARLGVQPDTQSATALLDACMRCRKVEMAESVFEELFNGLLAPDEVTFAVMVRGYGDQEPPRWTAISNAIATMEKDYGIVPSTLTYNALLEVCSKTKDEPRGAEIIARMAAAGIEPDDFTIEAVRQRKSLRSLLKKTF